MILYYAIVAIFIAYFTREFYSKRILSIYNIYILLFFLRFYLFSPLISEGYIFSAFFDTEFKPEIQEIYDISAIFILLGILFSNFTFNNINLKLIIRVDSKKKFLLFYNFLIVYSILYFYSKGVTPPILSPLFGESVLKNRLLLTHNNTGDSIIFYGNTVFKDYLLKNLGLFFVFYYFKYKKYLKYVLILIFFIIFIGRKSSLANFILFSGIALYNFKIINVKRLVTFVVITFTSLLFLFSIYGYNDVLVDLGVRALIVESSFSYFQYDLYFDKPELGINIFNFPFSESIFNLEHFEIKKDTYEQVFPNRVDNSGDRNAQGFAPLLLIIAFGKTVGYSIYFSIVIFTLSFLKIIQRSITINNRNPFYFTLYFITLNLSMNYFGVNIFSIIDFTIINFKYLIFILTLLFFNKFKLLRNVYFK